MKVLFIYWNYYIQMYKLALDILWSILYYSNITLILRRLETNVKNSTISFFMD